MDFGLKTFITTSDGDKIDSPKFLKQKLKQLKKATAKRDKVEKGTKDRKRKTRIVQTIFRKITNQRSNFNHQLANKIIAANDIIVIEDLNIQKLSSGQINNINRTYKDVSWTQFAQMLAYKAENAGRKVIKINPSNTSKTCNSCEKIHELTLQDRVISCNCGHNQDRDLNAAKNILALGLQYLAQA